MSEEQNQEQAPETPEHSQETIQAAMKILNSPWGNHLISQCIHIGVAAMKADPENFGEITLSEVWEHKIRDIEMLRDVLFVSYAELAGHPDQYAAELAMQRMGDAEVEEVMQEAHAAEPAA